MHFLVFLASVTEDQSVFAAGGNGRTFNQPAALGAAVREQDRHRATSVEPLLPECIASRTSCSIASEQRCREVARVRPGR